MRAKIVLVFHLVATLYAQEIGQPCVVNNIQNGTCIPFNNCPNARAALQPKICGFKGKQPVICCSLNISEEKCNQWKVLNYESYRIIGGGVDSLVKEFPHMAALGYGSANDKQWFCGGSLISEKFVLTAAHCMSHREIGQVNFVRLGDLNLRAEDDDASPQDFEVVRRIKHPLYKSSLHYNDIALLELDRPAEFDEYVHPACIQSTKAIRNGDTMSATGWGRLSVHGPLANHLQKLTLRESSNADCRKFYNKTSLRLPKGIVEESQLCAVGEVKQDTCQGDSGGPLQIKPDPEKKVYVIVGVTSFGKACLISTAPGVYTRVSNYAKWIESIVWGK